MNQLIVKAKANNQYPTQCGYSKNQKQTRHFGALGVVSNGKIKEHTVKKLLIKKM